MQGREKKGYKTLSIYKKKKKRMVRLNIQLEIDYYIIFDKSGDMYEQRDSNSYGKFPLLLKKRLATNFSMFAKR